MAALKNDHKRLLVQRLATFVAPVEIQAEFKTLGLDVSLSQISYYDPASSRTDLAAEWRALFAETRAQFVKDTASIAIAHKAFRLRELDSNYRAMKKSKNLIGANSVLEQAAKEMGEAYTNKRVIESADPAAALAALLGVSSDEVTAAVAGVGASAS